MLYSILALIYFLGITGTEHDSLQALTCHASNFQPSQLREKMEATSIPYSF